MLHNVTVLELDKIAQKYTVEACTRSRVSSSPLCYRVTCDIVNKGCVVSSNLVDFVICSFRACALETMRMIMMSLPLDTSSAWRGEGPGDHCS